METIIGTPNYQFRVEQNFTISSTELSSQERAENKP